MHTPVLTQSQRRVGRAHRFGRAHHSGRAHALARAPARAPYRARRSRHDRARRLAPGHGHRESPLARERRARARAWRYDLNIAKVEQKVSKTRE